MSMEENIEIYNKLEELECPLCNGMGFVDGTICKLCSGFGVIFRYIRVFSYDYYRNDN